MTDGNTPVFFCTDCVKYITATTVLVLSSVVLLKWLRPAKRERQCGVDYPRDVVMVHQFPKTKTVPSLGHFVIKLETYLRMADIPFKPCHDPYMTKSPKGKVPWIEYNGVTMGDSQLIINHLNKEFRVDLNQHLGQKQRAHAWAIQKWLEEFTYWLNVYSRWYIYADDMFASVVTFSRYIEYLMRRKVKKISYSNGVARHTPEEVANMLQHDLRQLSILLGDQQYLMGDQPSEVDCTAFGQLAQIRWATPDTCPGRQLLLGELKNITDYMDRIKARYWPDWDERLDHSE